MHWRAIVIVAFCTHAFTRTVSVSKADGTITTRNICNIRNSSFGGNIEELAMIEVFLVLSLVAIATLLNISFTDNQERISKEWALFGQCHYKSFIAT
jgi:hypothetical protein